MLKIACSGLGGPEIAKAAKATGADKVEVKVIPDMQAAKAVKSGEMDYFIGSCLSGSGGALSIAIAILGYANCQRISTAGGAPKDDEVRKLVLGAEKKGYGINVDHAKTVTPVIVQALLEKHGLV